MTRTVRIYNDAKRWFHNVVSIGLNGFNGDFYYVRKFHPFKQNHKFKCHCDYCRPKKNEIGSIRSKRKQYILDEIMNI